MVDLVAVVAIGLESTGRKEERIDERETCREAITTKATRTVR